MLKNRLYKDEYGVNEYSDQPEQPVDSEQPTDLDADSGTEEKESGGTAGTTGNWGGYGTYNSKYADQISDLTNQILGRDKFSYDHTTDPLYQQYAESYERNGQDAMKNTLAQMAARTGGLASSYAGTAAQNAYNGYMQELSDKIPELYELAYSMYQDEGDEMQNKLSLLQTLDDYDYDRWSDQQDRNYTYAKYLDSLNNTSDSYASEENSVEEATTEEASSDSTDYSQDEAVIQFQNSVLTPNEFSRRGNRASVDGTTYKFTDYNQYLEEVLAKWYETDRLTDDQTKYLALTKYKLG